MCPKLVSTYQLMPNAELQRHENHLNIHLKRREISSMTVSIKYFNIRQDTFDAHQWQKQNKQKT